MKYYIPTDAILSFNELVKKNSHINLSVICKETEYVAYTDANGKNCYINVTEVDISGKLPNINNWRLIASYSKFANGCMDNLNVFPGGDKIFNDTSTKSFPNIPGEYYILYNTKLGDIAYTQSLKQFFKRDVSEYLNHYKSVKEILSNLITDLDIYNDKICHKYLMYDFKDVLAHTLYLLINDSTVNNLTVYESVTQKVIDIELIKKHMDNCMQILRTDAKELTDIKIVLDKWIVVKDDINTIINFGRHYLEEHNYTAYFGKVDNRYLLKLYFLHSNMFIYGGEKRYVSVLVRGNAKFAIFSEENLFGDKVILSEGEECIIEATVSYHKTYFGGAQTYLKDVVVKSF